jgi:hypothetical protein
VGLCPSWPFCFGFKAREGETARAENQFLNEIITQCRNEIDGFLDLIKCTDEEDRLRLSDNTKNFLLGYVQGMRHICSVIEKIKGRSEASLP